MRIAVEPDVAGDPQVRRLIHNKACRLVGRAGVTWSDVEDIEQELWVSLLSKFGNYEPRRGSPYAFAKIIIDRHAATMTRRRRAQKRDDRHVASLSARQDTTSGSVELSGTIGTGQNISRRHACQRSDVEQACLQSDIHDVLPSLSPRERVLAERLQHQSISGVARHLGVPRTSLYADLSRIRRRFQRSDLQHYLHCESSPQ